MVVDLKINTSEDLNRLEIRLIRLLKYRYGNRCYNIQKGGCGGYFIYYMNEEQRQEVFRKISEGKKKQYALGKSEKQLVGRKKASETLKARYQTDEAFYNKMCVDGNKTRVLSLKKRRSTTGKTEKEKAWCKKIGKFHTIFVTYKLKYPDGEERIETKTIIDFRNTYKTQDIIFSHIKKYGTLKFLQKKNISKHLFPTGTEISYISEYRAIDVEEPKTENP